MNKNRLSTFILLIVSVLGPLSCSGDKTATLVLHNAVVYTVDAQQPQAEAVAVDGNIILATGNNNEIKEYIGPETRVIDLSGQMVIPGFIEGHAHFMSLGRSKMRLQLAVARDFDAVIAVVKEAIERAQPGEWILGRGWHQEKWDRRPGQMVEGYPLHERLSAVSPDNPVILTHASGHAILVNQKAIQLAGINNQTADPEGGRIIRDTDGNATGIFLENAELLITDIYDAHIKIRSFEERRREWRDTFIKATEVCLQNGITSFHDAGATFEVLDFFREMADNQRLFIRLYAMVDEPNDSLELKLPDYKWLGYSDNHLTVRAIKRYMDGALGARGAWLLEPYTDLPSSSGLNTVPLDEFEETARLARKHGFQLCTHAIGDRANRETLNIYGQVLDSRSEGIVRRWRIEHAQNLHPADVPRFGQWGIIASMQAIHCTSDGSWVHDRLGETRAEQGAYVWRKLIDSGALISNGTDAPVEDISPIDNFYAAVTRRMANGETFYPGQRMTRKEALRACTLNPAYAEFAEDIKGSLTAGKLADITVLSQDIMTVPEEEIPATEIVMTIIGGRILYQRN